MTTYYNNKTCWITGGGSGIGEAISKKLADSGASVIVSGRDLAKLKSVASHNDKIFPLQLDVTDRASWEQAMSAVTEKFSSIDLVVFNAGSCKYIDLPDFPPQLFEDVFNVNFMGIVNGLHHIMPNMLLNNSGHIAVVTSSVALLPLPRAEAYGASKAAATYLIDSLRLALSETEIKLTNILPGFIDTPMTKKNDFPMPFMITSEDAADRILNGLAKNKKEIYFPRRFTWPLRFLAALPTFLNQLVTKRLKKA
ncbi:MAG: SDR family NAD(P)-dependent oxidoreductase [Lentisphaeraceae bacterium]|nr:SDR family NAD(P)-dependent oxidoreductase [Lentisphaeraceae bacterium]